jgi:RNA polymerase sigma-70 factor, ECF subfamily
MPSPEGSSSPDVTALLLAWRQGDRGALERLMPLVYGELRRLAVRSMAGERRDHTLQPTALVHEAFLRLAGDGAPSWESRDHFFAVSALVMRRLLVDHARARRTAKRGAGGAGVPLDESVPAPEPQAVDLVALDEALAELAACDQRKARVVELRFFGGLTIPETARLLGISTATVILDTRLARAWLFRRLEHGG